MQDGAVRTAEFFKMQRIEAGIILQGVQKGLGWSLMVSEASGKANLTAAGNAEGFLVFGACIAE